MADFEFVPVVTDGVEGFVGRVEGLGAAFDTESGEAGLCGAEGIEAEGGGIGLVWVGEECGVGGAG
ncbi:MAG: hypothetical protein RI897_1800 [Verrucomicrobiota bacterium]